MAKYAVVIVSCLLLRLSTSTEVVNCGGDALSDVIISNCEDEVCKLKRNTNVTLSFKITPDKDVERVKNFVQAIMGLGKMPFIGVHGTDACDEIYFPDGSKAGCPLKKGEQYVYKNEIWVHPMYPKISVIVHWALATDDGDLICFEVPAKITN